MNNHENNHEQLSTSQEELTQDTTQLWIQNHIMLDDVNGFEDEYNCTSCNADVSETKDTHSISNDDENHTMLEKAITKDYRTPKEKRIARIIGLVSIILTLTSFAIVGATLTMSQHIDEMGR